MSIVEQNFSRPLDESTGDGGKAASKSLHRISEVRRQQGVSLRSAARQMKSTAAVVRDQEKPSSDLRLTDLLKWQQVLDVPLTDLIREPSAPLSRPVMERARLVRLMKTAAAIAEQAESESLKRMAEMMVDQLVEVMPELAEVSAWHSVGQRRSLDEFGRVVERRLRDDFFSIYRED